MVFVKVPLWSMVFQWFFLLVNHRCRWFSTSQPLVSMVFPMFFSLETMVFQWFFAVEPLVSMVFLPLNHWYQWFVQWLLTVETLGSMIFQWFGERAMVINGSQNSANRNNHDLQQEQRLKTSD